MAINLTLRSVKGSPLTASEVDANFSTLAENVGTALASSGVVTVNGRNGNVTLTSADVSGALGYTPVNPNAVVSSFNTRHGAVTLTSGDVTSALGFTPASLSGPTFTGEPKAPTATAGTNTTQIASTAFVNNAVNTAVADAVDFGASLANKNGYVTLPGGFLLQWGESPVITEHGNQTTSITFPTPFTSVVYQVVVGTLDYDLTSSAFTQRVCKLRGAPTLTGAEIDADSWESNSADEVKVVYFAIGR